MANKVPGITLREMLAREAVEMATKVSDIMLTIFCRLSGGDGHYWSHQHKFDYHVAH